MSDDSDVEAMLEAPFMKEDSEVGKLARHFYFEVSHDQLITVQLASYLARYGVLCS